jgi:hypothetical protein
MKTLEEAKEHLRENYKDGTRCPCCDQFVKQYKRKINSTMAYGLILMNKNPSWLHSETFFHSIEKVPSSIRGDLPKLRHWGLIEKEESGKEDGNPNQGLYRITQAGKDFVAKRITVSKYAYSYNNKIQGFSEESCTIDQCLGNNFNYSELMATH